MRPVATQSCFTTPWLGLIPLLLPFASGVQLFQAFGPGIQRFQTFGLGSQLFQSFGSAIPSPLSATEAFNSEHARRVSMTDHDV